MATLTPNLVSVVIPCYNQAHFLGETIESVLKQTYPHCEIIVVDDGSPDNTAEVALSYPQVRLIRQHNQGQAAARNTGLLHSTGSYVVFLDSDDRLLPTALAVGIKHLTNHPECAFVAGHCQVIAADGAPLPTERRAPVERDHYLALLRDNYIWMPAMVMHRRAILEQVGNFNTSLRMKGSEDYDLYLRITRSCAVYCHDEVVAEYRQHGASISHNAERMLAATLTVYREQWQYVKGIKRYEEAYEAGKMFWQERYGDPLINDVRAQVRQVGSAMRRLMHTVGVLWRFYPRAVVKHASKKLMLTLRSAPSAAANER